MAGAGWLLVEGGHHRVPFPERRWAVQALVATAAMHLHHRHGHEPISAAAWVAGHISMALPNAQVGWQCPHCNAVWEVRPNGPEEG